jgi:hypothetical protein
VIALLQPAFTPERPQTVNLYYVDNSSAPTPLWLTYDVTEPLAKVATFVPGDPKLTPWNYGTPMAAPAPDLRLPCILVSGERTARGVTIRATSQRNAGRISVFVRGGTILRTNGVTPPPAARHRNRLADGWQVTNGSGVQELVVEVEATGPVQVIASDTTFALPAEGAALIRARNASTATTIQDGDVTVTRTRAAF